MKYDVYINGCMLLSRSVTLGHCTVINIFFGLMQLYDIMQHK